MTLQEIKAAIDAGKTVHWSSAEYQVIRDTAGEYVIASLDSIHTRFIFTSGHMGHLEAEFYIEE